MRRRGFGEAGEAKVLRVLVEAGGRVLGMDELYQAVTGREVAHRINDTRELRHTVAKLRRLGWPICSTSSRRRPGYYLARHGEELERFCRRLEARGLKSLAQAAALRRLGLPELLGQLALAEAGAGEEE